MTQIGKALRDARKAAGIKQNELAAILDISPTMLNFVEVQGKPFPERLYAKLPDEIRKPVIDAAIAELRAKVQALRDIR